MLGAQRFIWILLRKLKSSIVAANERLLNQILICDDNKASEVKLYICKFNYAIG